MKRLFYKWLYKRFYKRVLAVGKAARKKKQWGSARLCVAMLGYMGYIKDELTGGSS